MYHVLDDGIVLQLMDLGHLHLAKVFKVTKGILIIVAAIGHEKNQQQISTCDNLFKSKRGTYIVARSCK